MKRFTVLAVIALILLPLHLFAGEPAPAQNYTIPLTMGLTLRLAVAPFIPADHQITQCQIFQGSDTAICLIDGKPVFGAEGGMPRNQLVKATIEIGSRIIDLDVSCLYNVNFEKADSTWFDVDRSYDQWTIKGKFSDAPGAYQAEWSIFKGIPMRTSLARVPGKDGGC